MEEQGCPNLRKCPMFERFKLQATSALFIQLYFNGDYTKCVRKKLRDEGKDVPSNLLPDGESIPQ